MLHNKHKRVWSTTLLWNIDDSFYQSGLPYCFIIIQLLSLSIMAPTESRRLDQQVGPCLVCYKVWVWILYLRVILVNWGNKVFRVSTKLGITQPMKALFFNFKCKIKWRVPLAILTGVFSSPKLQKSWHSHWYIVFLFIIMITVTVSLNFTVTVTSIVTVNVTIIYCYFRC